MHAHNFLQDLAVEVHVYKEALEVDNAVRSVGLWVVMTLATASSAYLHVFCPCVFTPGCD